ncbi:putative efflux protein, MATE family [Lachnospiraceae bacterium]|nr:putative efflux protein, MATE family [Lachnospiraceae bacterium]
MKAILEIFRDRKFITKLNTLMFPIAVQNLLLASVAAADAVMLGRLDQNSMAAVSLATQVQFVLNMFIASATSTGVILGAQYWGKRDKETLNDIYSLMLNLVGIVDIAFAAACIVIPWVLMLFFTNDPVLSEIGCKYLRIAGWSYLITGFSQVYLAMMKVSERAGRTALISGTAVVINIILNAVFIFGLFGSPAMGAEGAALATLISRVIELVWCVISSYQKGFIHPDFKRIFKRNRLLEKDFFKIAAPILGACLLWGVGFTSYTAIMGHLGADAAAANSVAAVVRDLTCCFCNGIASAGGIMLGYELGAGKMEQARKYGHYLRDLSWLTGILTMLIILAVTPAVAEFMILTPEAKKLLYGMLAITSFYMIGRCVNTVVINGIFDGGGDTQFDVYSLVVSMWIVAIPVACLGAFILHWHVLAVYACTCLDEVGKIPWVMHHFKKYKWIKNLTR